MKNIVFVTQIISRPFGNLFLQHIPVCFGWTSAVLASLFFVPLSRFHLLFGEFRADSHKLEPSVLYSVKFRGLAIFLVCMRVAVRA